MKNILANPKSSAIASLMLSLPFVSLFLLLRLGIEPDFGAIEPWLNRPTGQPDVVGSLIVLGAFLLLVVAFIISLVPLVRNARSGVSLASHPLNLLLAGAILSIILLVVGAIIVDQYPCWIGVPNCD